MVTGPSGSGKTTTLCRALNCLNRNSCNLATIEDPVDITLSGINPVAVFPRITLSFARILRSLIRQDPDVRMIGEIRDRETAEIAIQAAQTGHLVLSPLHAATGLEAINRLAHRGLPRYELVSSLRLVAAQRLLRTPNTGRIGVSNFCPSRRPCTTASSPGSPSPPPVSASRKKLSPCATPPCTTWRSTSSTAPGATA